MEDELYNTLINNVPNHNFLNKIYNQDCVSVLKTHPEKIINLTILDPLPISRSLIKNGIMYGKPSLIIYRGLIT